MKLIHKPHLLTRLEIWAPKYSTAYTDTEERVALLAKYKVDYASPVIIVEFTKAKHLMFQRFCIDREKAKSFPLESNTKIPCYAVPMSAFEPYELATELRDEAFSVFEERE